MLLVINVNNTHTALGLFEDSKAPSGENLIARWRIKTDPRTTDETRVLLTMLLQQEGIDPKGINGCCIASVVPPVNFSLEKACRRTLELDPLFVGPGVRTGLVIQVENPKELGADRIVNAVAGLTEYGGPLIIVDFGTATTFDVVTGQGEYRGGVIVPGIQISADALFERCAKLSRIEIAKPPKVIGRNTVDHIRAGLTYGYAEMADGLIRRITNEMAGKPTVVATGGFAVLMSDTATLIDHVDPLLPLKGLGIVYARNQQARSTR